ncbi:MAG: hypothetical protein R3249_10500 [Nitriliruptorales bacterium]|nr:hypothetical protein [Nitriliruptorales bacterium]
MTIGRVVNENVRMDVVRNPSQHRLTVIKRLLDAGLSASTLASVLPEFQDVIQSLTAAGEADEPRHLAAVS